MTDSHTRTFAFVAAALMLVAPVAYVTLYESEDTESDAAIGVIAAFAAGFVVGYVFGSTPESGTSEQDARAAEANAIITGLAYGNAAIDNAQQNYAQLWLLTSEHWVRQAELASTANWSEGATYDPYSVLSDSGVYSNAAYMIANAAAQLNKQFVTLSERVSNWGDTSYLSGGNMQWAVALGNESVSASSDDGLLIWMGTAVRGVTTGSDAVYYAGGPIWTSAACTITSASGHTLTLSRGWNDLPDGDDFEYADVYYLVPGVSYLGYFTEVIDSRSATLQAGLVAIAGGDTLFVTTDGYTLRTDGQSGIPVSTTGTDGSTSYDALKVGVVPIDSDAQWSDITNILDHYYNLLESIRSVTSSANQAARVMWNIYNDLGESCAYLTTLSLGDTYTNVSWTDDQLQLIVYLMMEQMAQYWDDYGELKTTDYRMTQDSLTLYCRGNICLSDPATGTTYTYAEGVAYTPVFFRDTSIGTGSNTTSSYCFVVVWGECSSLARFDATTYDDASIIYAPAGSVLTITEMYYDGAPATQVDLDCTEVSWIDPTEIQDPGPVIIDTGGDLGELIRMICMILGVLLIVVGLWRGSWFALGAGLVFVIVGLVFAESIGDFIEDITGAWYWPW